MGIEKICVPSPVGACGHFFIHTPSRRQCYIRFPGRTGRASPPTAPVARVRCGRLCAVCPAPALPLTRATPAAAAPAVGVAHSHRPHRHTHAMRGGVFPFIRFHVRTLSQSLPHLRAANTWWKQKSQG
jgi:hypothetical protein